MVGEKVKEFGNILLPYLLHVVVVWVEFHIHIRGGSGSYFGPETL
jgi:hypothetical protein